MKKKRRSTRWKVTNVRNLFLAFQMAIVLVLSGGHVYGMADEPLLNLSLKNVAIKDALWEIEKQSKMVFVYNADDLGKAGKISVEIKGKTVREALDICLKNSGFEYTIEQNTVVIKRKVAAKTTNVQKITVKGKVVDKSETGLPGVTIVLKGTSVGVVTDMNGHYSITIPLMGNPVLVFSFIGMKKQEVAVNDRQEINVILEEDQTEMEEVVVTGIYSRKKESFTGSSQTYKAEELKMIGNQNILQSLRTLDPSFKIVENNLNGSDPNALPEIEVRGANGIPDLDANYKGNPNQPLFILDGFEVSLQRVVDLDPNRVESISILKDASAAALYGSRSANGVIVIETKAPEIGRLRLSYNGDYAVVMPDLTDYDLLNAREALELQKDAGHFEGRSLSNDIEMKEYYNRMLKNVMEGVDTYWLSKPLRTAFEHRHNFELSGGDKVIRYGINFSVRMTPGVMKGSSHNNYMGGVFLQYRKGGLLFKNDLQITANESKNSPYGEFSQYVSLNPYVRPYDEQGRPVKLFDDKYPDFLEGSQFNKNPLYNATLHSVDEEK